jgi:hypothetical protein
MVKIAKVRGPYVDPGLFKKSDYEVWKNKGRIFDTKSQNLLQLFYQLQEYNLIQKVLVSIH